MPYNTSSVPAAVDALVAMCQDSSTLQNLVAGGVLVVDGPLPSPDLAVSRQILYVGFDPDENSAFDGEQQFATIGPSRDEHFRIPMCAQWWSGDTDMKTVRDGAFSIMAAVETLVRRDIGDPTLQGTVKYCQVARYRLSPKQTGNGVSMAVTFEIDCRSRL